MPGNPEDTRWGGRIEAELEAIRNELLPLKPLPGHMAIVANTMERLERSWKEEADRCAARDDAQDTLLAEIKKTVDKGANRRATLFALVPVLVALITTAGFLLKG